MVVGFVLVLVWFEGSISCGERGGLFCMAGRPVSRA